MDIGFPTSYDSVEFMLPKSTSRRTKVIKIASRNAAFERALTMAIDMRISAVSKKVKAKQVLCSTIAAPHIDPDTGKSIFIAEMSNPAFDCPRDLNFVSEYVRDTSPAAMSKVAKYKKTLRTGVEESGDHEVGGTRTNGVNAVAIGFVPERSGIYKSRLIVYAKDNPFDIRVVDVVATAFVMDPHACVEFRAPARQAVTQEIPIRNTSDHDWELNALIQGKGFSGPRYCKVLKDTTATYQLNFTGAYTGEFTGKLTFSHNTSEDTFEYRLLGVAEEPLAEDNLRLRCTARTKAPFSVPVRRLPSPTFPAERVQVFNVQTDLPYLMGSPTVEVEGTENVMYEFYILSPVSGFLTGSLTFKDQASNAMMWYTFDISVDAPFAEKELSVKAVVRTAVAVEIMLENPSTEQKVFDVVVEGEGLIGDSVFVVPPKSSRVPYELIYSPLRVGEFKGSISFRSPRSGQFWYQINLTALEAPAIEISQMECMMGSSVSTKVPVENPLSEEVVFAIQVADSDAFSTEESNIVLGPYGHGSFTVVFTPAKINAKESCGITLSHPSFGQVKYEVTGVGLMPGNMEPIEMSSTIGVLGSYTVPFQNPFRHPLPIEIILSSSAADGGRGDDVDAFELLLRKNASLVVPSHSTLQIGISFTPQSLRAYSAQMQIKSNVEGRPVLWNYPLIGVTDAGPSQHLGKLSIPCKTSTTKEFDVKLVGLRGFDAENMSINDLAVEVVADASCKHIISRALRVLPVDLVRVTEDPSYEFVARYKLRFEPLKMFHTVVNLVLSSKSLGRWKADFDLESTQPKPDDTIRLRAAVGSSDSVYFRLNNRFLTYSPFKCFFAPRSSSKFTVTPNSGVLPPYGTEGSSFMVTFSPTEYGNFQRAHLIISSDDAQWDYEFIGEFPEYNIDKQVVRSKTDTRR